MPKVSVIIPVYNVELYLEECLNSVINQTYKNLEIICIDDHSTDGSLEILRAYSCKDSRIVLLRNNGNHGLAYTRNRGIDRASGDYILFVDSDDYIREDLLEISLKNAHGNDMVCFDYIALNELGDEEITHVYELENGIYNGIDFWVYSVNRKSVIHSAWSKLYDRKFLINNHINFYNGILYEDILFTFRCFLSARTIYNTKEKLYRYRIRKDSIMTETLTYRHIESYFINLCELTKLYLEKNFDGPVSNAIEKYIQNIGQTFVKTYKACSDHRIPDTALIQNTKVYKRLYSIYSDLFNDSQKRGELKEYTKEYWRQYEKIIVYGAGNVARAVLEMLDQYDIPVYGIAVTSTIDNRKSLLGNFVREITWYMDVKEDCLVIIATEPIQYEEIRNKLQLYHFTNYVEAI